MRSRVGGGVATGRPVLVLGGGGLLGEALLDVLAACGRAAAAPPRAEVDLGDRAAIERVLDRLRPSAVINAAGFTDVAAAERPEHRAAVYRANRDGPALVAAACASRGVAFAHVSTDFVFDGRLRRPYGEDDPTAPLQVYGASKLAGESAVLDAHPAAIVARTSTLFGPARRRRPHYIEAILRQAAHDDRLRVVAAPVASPTSTLDLAVALLDLLDVGARGIVHVVNSGGCSRLELAREAVRVAYPERRIEIGAVPAEPGGPARPDYCVLDGARFARLTGRALRGWAEALADYVARRRT